MTTVFVLCAGKGERLWPFSTILPKALWPVGGKPCVRWIVERVTEQLHLPLDSTYVLCLKKDKSLFEHEFRDVEANIIASADPLGTAGQVAEAAGFLDLRTRAEDELLVHYGDCLVDVDYGKFLEAHRKSGGSTTLLLTGAAKSEYGMAMMGGPNPGPITGFVEKPTLNFPTWTGIAFMNRVAYGTCAVGKDIATDVFPALLKMQLTITGYEIYSPYWDIGTLNSYTKVNELAQEKKLFS